MRCSFFTRAALIRLAQLGSRPALRSSSAAYARRWVLTHKPKAGSPANSVGTLAWPCFFTNCRSATQRLPHMSGFTTHSNLMFCSFSVCSFFTRAALMRMVQHGSESWSPPVP
jgi:hypothetical protein